MADSFGGAAMPLAKTVARALRPCGPWHRTPELVRPVLTGLCSTQETLMNICILHTERARALLDVAEDRRDTEDCPDCAPDRAGGLIDTALDCPSCLGLGFRT